MRKECIIFAVVAADADYVDDTDCHKNDDYDAYYSNYNGNKGETINSLPEVNCAVIKYITYGTVRELKITIIIIIIIVIVS